MHANFNKHRKESAHLWQEIQTIKAIKCQILNEANTVTPNLTKNKQALTLMLKKVIYTYR